MYAIYARVSTDEQAKHGYSLQDQIRQCKLKFGKFEESIIEYVDDGYSGEFIERPALTKLIEDVDNGLITRVMCYKPDRLSRNLYNALKLTKMIGRRTKIEFVDVVFDDTPQGQFFYQNYMAMAEMEKNMIRERTMNGRKSKARGGKVVKDYNVYGYFYDKEAGQMQVNEDEAKIVNLIFDLFTNPQGRVRGINGIANYLTEQRIPTKLETMFKQGKTTRVPKNGWVWHKQVVRQILFNTAYKGEFYQNRWNTEGMLANKFKGKDEYVPMTTRPKGEWILVPCPSIIDESTFDLAQSLLQEARRRYAGSPKNVYLLSGLLRCGDCGNTMGGRKTKNWGKYEFQYSDIKNTAGAKNKGCGNHISCETLDKFVWDTFIRYVNDRGQKAINSLNTIDQIIEESFEEKELNRIEEEIRKKKLLRKHYQETYALAKQGENDTIFTLEDLEEYIKSTNEKLAELNIEQERLYLIIQKNKANEITEEILLDTINDFLNEATPNQLSVERKQDFIRRIFREIRLYDNGKVEFYNF